MKVLIAMDDSECSDTAFKSITERFWTKNAEFRIVTAVEPVYLQAPLAGMYCEPMVTAQNDYEKYCRNRVQERVKELEKQFPENTVSDETLLGPIAEVILDDAKHWDADLIVLGSHGRKGFSRFFLGSVAERVASHAPCSVEIVKQKLSSPSSDTPCVQEKNEETTSSEKKNAEQPEKTVVGGKANS